MKAAGFCAVVALAGCVDLSPRYERPKAPVPASLPGVAGGAAGTVANVPWQQFVRDERLQQLIKRALTQNRDLRRAMFDIESARAQYRIQRAELYPQVGANAGVSRAHIVTGPGNSTATTTTYSVGGSVSWELDVFGRVRALSGAKLQAYLSTVEVARATRVSLIAETSAAYVALAADRSRLVIAQETMDTAKKTMDLTNALVGGGVSNRGDFYQASTVFQQARADVALLVATIAQDKNALELLTGGPVPDNLLPDALPEKLDWFVDVPVGVSSDVLLTRPDVLAAEHDLQAANANIGAARAAFFPSLSLTVSGGLASASLASLFTGPAAVWAIAPGLAAPLFRGGANRAGLAYSKSQKQAFIARYELAIQTAFREVADALATRGTIEEQLAAQVALVEAAAKSVELAQARYQSGIDPFLATLVSQRALYTAKNALVFAQLAALENRVTLYRVLGGGA